MKHYHYRQPFNSREFGAAECRADKYWQHKREMMERGVKDANAYVPSPRVSKSNTY